MWGAAERTEPCFAGVFVLQSLAAALCAFALCVAAAAPVSGREGERPRPVRPQPIDTVEGVDFFNLEGSAIARSISERAGKAAEKCDETASEAYDAEIAAAEKAAASSMEDYERLSKKADEEGAKGNDFAADSFAQQAEQSNLNSSSYRQLAAALKRTKAEKFKRCLQKTLLQSLFPWLFPPPPKPAFYDPSKDNQPLPPPAPVDEPEKDEEPKPVRTRRVSLGPTNPLPGGLIDPNRPQFAFAAIFGNDNRPSFGAGTTFNVALGREVPIIFSPRNLTFAGGAVDFRAPVSSVFGADVPSPFSQMAFYAKLEGYSFWGSESGSVPFGGNNVAYTYLFPNPATGTTGVLAGATGQDISIKAKGEAIKFRAGAEWETSLADLRTVSAFITGGFAFDYTDSGYEIMQQSLFFPDVSSRTKLRVDDYFFAPQIGAGVRLDDGNIFASVSGFVAPGLLYTSASAKQKNLCGPCPIAGDRDFKLSSSFSNTRFAVQTGIDLKLGARLTPSIAVEGGFQYVYTSHAGFLRPPTTPNAQPVSLGYGSTNFFAGQLGVRFRF
jgi:hypothetical protein